MTQDRIWQRLPALALSLGLVAAACTSAPAEQSSTSQPATTTTTQRLTTTTTQPPATTTTTTIAPTVTSETDADTNPVVIGTHLPEMPGDQPIDASANGLRPPDVEGFDFDGDPVGITISDGEPKAIVFLAHWCPHCQKEVDLLVPWLAETGGIEGISLYSIATAIDPTRGNYPPSEWLEREGWNVPVIVDDGQISVFRAYGGAAFPFWVFVNSDGSVALRVAGELEIDELVEILESLT